MRASSVFFAAISMICAIELNATPPLIVQSAIETCDNTEGLACSGSMCFNDSYICTIPDFGFSTTTVIVTTTIIAPLQPASVNIWPWIITTILIVVILLLAAPCVFIYTWYCVIHPSATTTALSNRLGALLRLRTRPHSMSGHGDLPGVNARVPAPVEDNEEQSLFDIQHIMQHLRDQTEPGHPAHSVNKGRPQQDLELQALCEEDPAPNYGSLVFDEDV